MREKTKYFGIIVASEIFYYTFAEKKRVGINIHILNTKAYVLDVGISI